MQRFGKVIPLAQRQAEDVHRRNRRQRIGKIIDEVEMALFDDTIDERGCKLLGSCPPLLNSLRCEPSIEETAEPVPFRRIGFIGDSTLRRHSRYRGPAFQLARDRIDRPSGLEAIRILCHIDYVTIARNDPEASVAFSPCHRTRGTKLAELLAPATRMIDRLMIKGYWALLGCLGSGHRLISSIRCCSYDASIADSGQPRTACSTASFKASGTCSLVT